MAVEEGKVGNGSVMLESPREGLLTYRRKKRVRPSSDMNGAEVLQNSSNKDRNVDIGWKHGEVKVVDGNKYHWMCNWCGMTRYSGGVSKLKEHLAGGFNVRKCRKVPANVAKDILNDIMEKTKIRNARKSNRCMVHGVKSSLPNKEIQGGSFTNLTRGGTRTNETNFHLENATRLTKEGHKRRKINTQRRSKNAHKIDLEAQIRSSEGLVEAVQIESANRSYKGPQDANDSKVVEEVSRRGEINCQNHCAGNHEGPQNGNITGLNGGWSKSVEIVAHPGSSHTRETVTQVDISPELTKKVQVETVAGLTEEANKPRTNILAPVLRNSSNKDRDVDIGWKHGEVVDGNKSHWMCNWCGMIRYSGGVSKLKKHLAGGFNVRKCRKVPADVAKDILNDIMEKIKNRNARLSNRRMVHGVKSSLPNKEILGGSFTNLTRGGARTNETNFHLENATRLTKEGHKRRKINTQRRSKNAHKIDLDAQIRSSEGLVEAVQIESANRSYKGPQDANDSKVVEEASRRGEINGQNHCAGNHEGPQNGSSEGLVEAVQIESANRSYKGPQDANDSKVVEEASRRGEINGQNHCAGNHEGPQNGNITGLNGGWSKSVKIVAHPWSSHTSETVTQVDINPELTKKVQVETVAGLTEEANKPRTNMLHRLMDGNPSNTNSEHRKDINDTISCTNNTHESDKQTRAYVHWSNVLELILELHDMSEEGGIVNCIRDALKYGPGYSRKKISVSDRCLLDTEVEGQCQQDSFVNGVCGASETRTSGAEINTTICKKVFLDIICSEQFSLLCDLYWENFREMTVKSFFDFSPINSKMKSGDYELSPALFDQDIQQVWLKFQKVGQQMVHLTSSLSRMSQVGQKQGTCQVDAQQNNYVKSSQFNFGELDHSIRPNQIEASALYEVCTCKLCGMEANGERSLICDGCEATYHVSCVEPAIKEIPTRSWYCTTCTARNNDSPDSAHTKKGSLHQSCAACNRLKVSGTKDNIDEIEDRNVRDNGSRESSASSMDSDDHRELSGNTMSCLCKICGTGEDEDKKFLVCGHNHCPYKFYHIRCLKSSQIASQQQQNRPCWYCPSCLCRDCFCDVDDDKIVLCDGCDEAYHTYCMKPPRTSIPRGQWFCVQCNIARAREGMKRYEQWILQQHRKNEVTRFNETNRSMDLLLSAAEKLRSEEQLVSGR